MSTFRPNGSLRNNDDSQLWKEIMTKERFASKLHQEYRGTDHFASTQASRFGSGKFSMPPSPGD
jgi:hypothetical protein